MQTFSARLWSKVKKLGPSDCWPWMAGMHKGYGRIRFWKNGKWGHISAAKAIWEETNGPMPEGAEPEHTCNHTWCCNPAHIEATSHSENMARMWRRGRAVTRRLEGTSHGRHRFTREQVEAIKLDPRPSRELAKIYGVEKTTILRAKKGMTYKTDHSTLIRHV